MTTEEFIAALEQDEIIDADLARQMRAKAEEDAARVTPAAILKFLVKTDVITAWKGEELAAMLHRDARVTDEPEILDLMPLPEGEDDDLGLWSAETKPPIQTSGPPPEPFGPQSTDDVRQPLFSSKAARINDPSPPPPNSLGAASAAESTRSPGVFKLEKGKKKGTTKRTAGGRNQWDSPLLLMGGGALAVLLVGGAILYYLLIRENADAVLADAKNLFDSGAYRQASDRYAEFVENFPRHQEVSESRVRSEMSTLWEAVENDAAGALPEAQRVIGEIEDEISFTTGAEGEEGPSTAKQELGTILVRIGKALVDYAETSTDQEQVEQIIDQLDAVLALSANDKYVPQKFRNEAELAAIAESLEVIRSRQQRDARLAAALAKMDEAIAAGDTSAAYKERLMLLADYPALAEDAALVAKVRAASTAEQAGVKFASKQQAAETAWPPRAVVAELALAERRGGSAGAGATARTNEPVVIRVDGALYGLRSSDGSLLWRRFAGFGTAGAPLMLDGDVVAADLNGGELWRLNAETGKLVWRLPLGDQISGVVTAGQRLLATGASGKLFVVEADSGALVGHVEFSQPIRTPPVVNDRGDRIYIVAEHSILYTLSAEDFSCVGVYYSGHAAGAISAPPVAALDKVIVADNSGTETCRLRVLSVDSKGAVDGEIASERLNGLVLTPLARAARRMAAATTVGQLAVIEISGAKDASALSVVARREGHEAHPLARFALIHDGRLWLAAKQLMALDIVPTESQLSVRSLDQDFRGDAFDDVLRAVGPLVVHVRRPAGRAGVVVAATDATANRVAWQTEIAVPLAGAPAVDEARMLVSAVTASGAAYLLDRAALTRGVQGDAKRAGPSVAGEPPLTTSVDLGEGRIAAAAFGGAYVLLVGPDDQRQGVQSIELAGLLSCPLTIWNGRIVVATEEGRVAVYDAHTGAADSAPFLPELTPNRKFHWLAPAATGSSAESLLLISDGEQSLYGLTLAAEPTHHLAAEKSVDAGPSPLVSALAASGLRVFAGTADGRLASFLLPDLKPEEPLEIGGRIVWGPHAIDGGILFSTDANEMLAVDDEGEIRWRQSMKHGACGGHPLEADGSAWVLTVSGGIARIELADGTETGFADIGQPAVAGPVALGERVIVAAADGALLVVNRP